MKLLPQADFQLFEAHRLVSMLTSVGCFGGSRAVRPVFKLLRKTCAVAKNTDLRMRALNCIIGERERANLVVPTADFSLYLYISGAGRHHTVMFYVILNTRINVKFHKSSTKLAPRVRSSVVRLFVMQPSKAPHIVLCAANNFPRKLVNGN